MGLHKILKIVALLLSVVGIFFLASIVAKGDDVVKATGEGLDGILYVAYVMFALVLAFVLVFVLKGVFAGNIKKTLISIGVFLLIVAISYGMAEGVETPLRDNKMLSANGSRWAGAGLITFYILAIAAVGAMAFGGLKKLKK